MTWLTTQIVTVKAWFQQASPSSRGEDPERGDAIQWILVAIGGIALAGLVVLALTGKVEELISQL
ncbi:hypothetical protein [Promicromonospora sp. NFX87]|uniref:hypothetical protein n=1 Tax=Promicromonospora sp. NFX87 TaxID=3402691 RepID=UPI003AFA7CF8